MTPHGGDDYELNLYNLDITLDDHISVETAIIHHFNNFLRKSGAEPRHFQINFLAVPKALLVS